MASCKSFKRNSKMPLGQISDLANQVQNFVQSAADRSSAEVSGPDQSEIEAEIKRLRQTRKDDVNHINWNPGTVVAPGRRKTRCLKSS